MTDYLHALPPGYRIEEYELVRVLGSGGFGITYLGYDHHLDKAVAIKEYLPNDLAVRTDNNSVLPKSTEDKTDYEWGLERFLSEAQTLARFDHRHIIKVYRFFRAHGTGYIVMEYAEGETLSDLLQRKGTLEEAELKRILFPILDGLQVVHDADFLHRDIKPKNIVIRDDGSPVLIDFGSARQAVAGKSRSVTAIVTPGYAPVEQYSSKGRQGTWTDVYALGAVCYRCLAGEAPEDAMERLREDPLIPATRRCRGKAGKVFLEAIDRAMRVDEGQRPQSIKEWREALAGYGKSSERAAKSEHRPEIRPAEGSTTTRTGMSRSSLALAFVIVVLLGASVWQGWQFYRGIPGNDTSESIAVEEQPTDTRAGSSADVVLGTQEGSEVGAVPETGHPVAEPVTLPPAEEEDELTRLLAAAEADLTARRLTTPAGNNAWEKYQRVLELSPANPEAMAGMERVIGSYLELFESALEQEAFDKASTYLSRIRDLHPDEPGLADGERRLAEARQAAESERQKAEARARQFAGEMVSIPGGTFRMGDLSGDGYSLEKPVHSVTVRPFKIGKYEVTFAQWDACVADGGCGGYRPDDEGWGRGNRPVIGVSPVYAESFIDWLNNKTGGNYRLPTEAEWEYAARASSTTEYSWGNDIGGNRANCDNDDCGDRWEYTAPVGSFAANAWGLHDMHGNVWEWVQDCMHVNYEGAPTDGSAWTSRCFEDDSVHMLRGGSWFSHAKHLRSANRFGYVPLELMNTLGFRLAEDEPGLADGERHLAEARQAAESDRQEAKARARQVAGEMVSIPGGTFRMGELSEDSRDNEKPVRSVTVPSFRLGKYEVTVGQFRRFVEATGYRTDAERNAGDKQGCAIYIHTGERWKYTAGTSWRNPGFPVRDNHPVVCVSWNDVQAFVKWLNSKTDGKFRLPSEAEWEYAARARSTTKYHFGNDESQLCQYANHADSSTDFWWKNESCSDGVGKRPAEVGRYQPNGFGLHDMYGNVWEWVQDCWNDNYKGAPTDGSAWTSGDCGRRVLRGGSWFNDTRRLRSATRGWLDHTHRDYNAFGFRLAQDN